MNEPASQSPRSDRLAPRFSPAELQSLYAALLRFEPAYCPQCAARVASSLVTGVGGRITARRFACGRCGRSGHTAFRHHS